MNNKEGIPKVVHLFGVGFDEKLVIRAVLKVGVKPEDLVVLTYGATTSGEFEREKVKNAVRNLRKVLEGAGIKVIEIPIGAVKFSDDVKAIVDCLKEMRPSHIVVSLGSGMRYLAFVLLFSCFLYRELFMRDAKVVVHVAREDGLYDITANFSIVRVVAGRRKLDALCLLHKGLTRRDEAVKKSMEALGIRHSAFYRLLERMERDGLIAIKDGVIELTEFGEAIAAVKCSK